MPKMYPFYGLLISQTYVLSGEGYAAIAMEIAVLDLLVLLRNISTVQWTPLRFAMGEHQASPHQDKVTDMLRRHGGQGQ